MLNGLQALDYWKEYFNFPDGSTLGLMSSMMSIGSICAIPFVPYAADILGRRTGVLIGCLIMILGVVLQTISVNIQMFIAGRFFIGFGVAIAHGSSPLLITELAHPQHRAIFTTIYNTTWYIGSIVAAWLTFGTNNIPSNWSWRAPTLVMAFPSILQLIFIWTVPESPRWLISKGKLEKAHQVLAKCHANGDMHDELVVLEVQEIRDTIKMEQEFESTGWSELWKTKGNRHRLVILLTAGFFSQWSGNGIASYYLPVVLGQVGITDSYSQTLINGILQIVNLIVAVGMCFFVERVGRRKLFLFATAGMGVVFVISTICYAQSQMFGNPAAGRAVVAFIFIYYICYNSAWSGLLVGYSVEILPFNIRAKGITVMFLSVDVALWFNQYVNPIALENIGWKYYIVYDVWLAVELAVVYFFYIETRNTPLEGKLRSHCKLLETEANVSTEIAKHFDGEKALVGGAAATEKGAKLAEEMGLEDTVRESSISKGVATQHKEVEA